MAKPAVKTPEEILEKLIEEIEDPAFANGPAAQRAVRDAKAYFEAKAATPAQAKGGDPAPAAKK